MSAAQKAQQPDAKKLIWTIGRKLNMEEADIRSLLLRETGKESMRACSDQELQRVVLSLRQLQGDRELRGDKATFKQIGLIHRLEEALGWKEQPERLRGFLRHYYQVDKPEWLTRAQAWRAIESLKNVRSRQ